MASSSPTTYLRQPPFVLLDDNRPATINNGRGDTTPDLSPTSLLFINPSEILVAKTLDEVEGILSRIDTLVEEGRHLAGYIAYEVAAAFEVKIKTAITQLPDEPLIWMMVCDAPIQLTSEDVSELIHASDAGSKRSADIVMSPPSKDKDSYLADLDEVLGYINSGDTYQINYTFDSDVQLKGDALTLYNQLRTSQPVAYGALINTGEHTILSFSPELFIHRQGPKLTSRPMKGTMPRGKTALEDQTNIDFLQADPKSKAENLMIVDLIRNDLSRIAKPGTVHVDHLYDVETYRTVLQMTSTVSAEANVSLTPSKMLKAMFPCGSITGAPKIRAMEIIATLEAGPRGVYCGAIGHFSPDNNWTLNVPIRTMILDNDGKGRLHLGSGIVADSDPIAEYNECILKGAFIHQASASFCLIETMLWQTSSKSIPHLKLHIDRLSQSAIYFQFPHSLDDINTQLAIHMGAINQQNADQKIRLLMDNKGNVSISSADAPLPLKSIASICFYGEATHSDDIFLYHKTTQRHLYNTAFKAAAQAGYVDTIFTNQNGEITEGAISNIVIELDGTLITPPVTCGLLDGIGRKTLCQGTSGQPVTQMVITKDMVLKAEAVYILNSLRGLTPVKVIDYTISPS